MPARRNDRRTIHRQPHNDSQTVPGRKKGVTPSRKSPKLSSSAQTNGDPIAIAGRQERLIRLILAAVRVWELKNRALD